MTAPPGSASPGPPAGLPAAGRPEPGAPGLVVVFVLEGARYAVSLESAERALRMVAISPLPGGPPVLAGVINMHGKVVPVVDLRRRLGLAPSEYRPGASLVLVNSPRRTLALPADEVLGVRALPEGSVAPGELLAPGLKAVAGIAALPDGVVFIHDLEAFLTAEEERGLDQALQGT